MNIDLAALEREGRWQELAQAHVQYAVEHLMRALAVTSERMRNAHRAGELGRAVLQLDQRQAAAV